MIGPTAPRVERAVDAAAAGRRAMFCVAAALRGADDLDARLSRAFGAARIFLSANTAADVLAAALEDRGRRSAVAATLDAELHVGFMTPNEPGVADAIAAAAHRAGFTRRRAPFASAVIALELGGLTGRPSVPTTIFKAHGEGRELGARSVEAFVPLEDRGQVNAWIDGAIGTHIGLKVASARALPEVVELFLADGYRLPSFLRGGAISNPAEGSIVAYVEKASAASALRIELFSEAERSK